VTRLAAIVLAAGRSSRMGELKPLLPLGDGTVLGRTVGAFLEAGVTDLRVVVGWRAAEVAAAASDLGVVAVTNRDWSRGMFSSVATGVAALGADVEAFLLLPADCALVRAETIGRLARAALAAPAPVTYPLFEGRRGHPPLIARDALPGDLTREPPDGLRGLLARLDGVAREVGVDDAGVLVDLDEPDDYRRAREYVAGENIPGAARCLEMLREAAAPAAVVAHSRAVACVATALAVRLNACGLHLNARLVEAAGLLHDIARTQPDHARAGAVLLGDLGYRRVAAVTARHMDLQPEVEGETGLAQGPVTASRRALGGGEPSGEPPLPGEAEVLYLADKLVSGTEAVGLSERVAARLSDLPADSAAAARARERMGRAQALARVVETLIGEPVETVARAALAEPPDPS